MMQSSLRHDGPSALQSLAESLGAASCMFFEHDRENSPAPAPMSEGHVAFADRLTRNWAHAPDPHVGPYLKNAIRSKERVGRPSWNTISRPRKSAAQFLSIRRRRDRRSGSGWRGPFSRSKAAIGACRSSAEATRLRAKTRDALPGSDPISAKSSVWPKSLPRSTSPRSSQRWSESVPPPSSSTQRAAQGK